MKRILTMAAALAGLVMIGAAAEPDGEKDLQEVQKTLDGKEHPCLHNAKGYLGFMAHHSRVGFRNIRIKEIQ